MYNCYVQPQWNYYSEFNDTLCTGDYYDRVGKYGFCEKKLSAPTGAKLLTPSKISSMQGLAIASTVSLFFASLAAIAAPSQGGKKSALSAGFLSFVSACLCGAAFSVAVSFDWYQSFGGNGGTLPFVDGMGKLYVESSTIRMYWGPAFWSVVGSFIISLLASASMCAVSKNIDQVDLDGTYSAEANAHNNNAGYAEAGEYGYGVEKA